jgi:AcrR family transcriptional regulator
MARPPKEDWVPLMRSEAVKRLREGREVKVMEIAEELGTSPALVHFYFGDRQHLVDEAWREILWAYVDDDSERVAEFAKDRNWDGVAALVREVLSEERDDIHAAHVRAAGEGAASADLGATLREVHEATIDNWVKLLRQSIVEGQAETSVDLDALATLIVAVPIGLAAVDPDMEPARRAAVAAAYTSMLRSVLDAVYSAHA